MSALQILVDPPAVGAWNMAVDERLMHRAAEQREATLRLYRWSPATLSLGYFQHAAERETHAASRSCPLVRRSSGGGAILHDHELTYSLSLPISHPAAADPETLYRRTHGLLVEVLAEFGIVATLNERTLVPLGGEPFLCFQRRSVGDVLVDGHKICGSAQRRRKGALLQHGSILVAASSFAPELPGLAELSGRSLTIDDLQRAWLDGWRRWSHAYGLPPPLPHAGLNPSDDMEVARICAEQYGSDALDESQVTLTELEQTSVTLTHLPQPSTIDGGTSACEPQLPSWKSNSKSSVAKTPASKSPSRARSSSSVGRMNVS